MREHHLAQYSGKEELTRCRAGKPRRGVFICSEHVRQLGGESPLLSKVVRRRRNSSPKVNHLCSSSEAVPGEMRAGSAQYQRFAPLQEILCILRLEGASGTAM